MNLLGIDIGGTKTAICIGDEAGHLRWSQRMPTGTSEGPERSVARMIELVGQGLRETGLALSDIAAVGVACPGPMSVKDQLLLEPPNMKGWINVPIVKMLAAAIDRPITINNDANACALAEYQFGSHRGAAHLVYLTASTGLGAGFVINGHVIQGATDLAGEVGHHVLDIHGPPCPCGQHGCWEMYCGGLNVANRVRRAIQSGQEQTVMAEMVGGQLDLIDFAIIREAVRLGDPFAITIWEEFVERMAHGIGNIIQFMNPEVIILGTIAIHSGDLLMGPLREKLPKYAWRYGRDACQVVPSALGPQIGELSALALALYFAKNQTTTN